MMSASVGWGVAVVKPRQISKVTTANVTQTNMASDPKIANCPVVKRDRRFRFFMLVPGAMVSQAQKATHTYTRTTRKELRSKLYAPFTEANYSKV